MIIDFHVHINEDESASANGIPVKMGREEILSNMEDAGIDISVLLVMAKKGEFQKSKEKNEWLSEVCHEDSHFLGFGSVHPDDGEKVLNEMDRCIDELGLNGFKLHPNTQEFDCGSPNLVLVLKKAADLDVPVIIDSYSPWDDTQPSKILTAAMASPDTKLCMAHVGMWRFMDFGVYGFVRQRTAIEMNVYFDLSATSPLFYQTPFHDQFLWLTKQIGSDYLLFGSDFPLFLPKNGADFPLLTPKYALDVIRNFGYPDDWIPKITGGNAVKLLHI